MWKERLHRTIKYGILSEDLLHQCEFRVAHSQIDKQSINESAPRIFLQCNHINVQFSHTDRQNGALLKISYKSSALFTETF